MHSKQKAPELENFLSETLGMRPADLDDPVKGSFLCIDTVALKSLTCIVT